MITYLLARLNILNHEKGATAVEYALLVALIALAIIIAVTLLGTQLSALFTRIANTIAGV